MRVSISNLSFPTQDRAAAYARLRSAGARGIEVAPTRLGSWDEIDAASGRRERDLLSDHGLEASSLQAIFYGRPELQLLGDPVAFDLMVDHIGRLGDYADAIGAGVAVFGAPAHRNRGNLSLEAASDLAKARMRVLGEVLSNSGLALCIEPIPEIYRGDFLQTYGDVIEMVRQVDHPRIKLHLDTGCVMLGGGDMRSAITEGVRWLSHFQAAEPNLKGFDTPVCDHMGAARALREIGYEGWVAIEMLEQGADPLAAAEQALVYATEIYADSDRPKLAQPLIQDQMT